MLRSLRGRDLSCVSSALRGPLEGRANDAWMRRSSYLTKLTCSTSKSKLSTAPALIQSSELARPAKVPRVPQPSCWSSSQCTVYCCHAFVSTSDFPGWSLHSARQSPRPGWPSVAGTAT